MEGPPPTPCEKGGCTMAAPTLVFTPLRKEVQDYIRSCEQLLSPTMFTVDEPLSAEERKMIEYFVNELKTHLLAQKQQS
jgi:hypothetical protein